MNAVDRLRRDHKILRAKLDVLEAALRLGGETWFVLREVCFTLSRQLQDHIKREEDLVAACRQAMVSSPVGGGHRPRSSSPGKTTGALEDRSPGPPTGMGINPKVLAEVVVEHRDEPELLRQVNRLFVAETSHTLERISPALTQVIQGLRRHMAQEEVELFPILERVLAAPEPRGAEALPAGLDEVMTVNRVVQEFPRTKPVFERFFINIPLEGCTCLDEVAWRHGMETRELVAQLEQAITSCGCRTTRPAHAPEATPAGSERPADAEATQGQLA